MIGHIRARTIATGASATLIAGTLLWLFCSGAWRGCVLSGAWCRAVSDSEGVGELPSSYEHLRRFFSTSIGLLAIYARLHALWVPKHLRHEVGGSKIGKRDIYLVATWRILGSGALLSVTLCLIFPMSCGALIDGKRWIYLTMSDIIHDASLVVFFVLVGAAFLAFKSHTHSVGCKVINRTASIAVVCAIPMLVLVNWCPLLPGPMRIVVLAAEVVSLWCAQSVLVLMGDFAHSRAHTDAIF